MGGLNWHLLSVFAAFCIIYPPQLGVTDISQEVSIGGLSIYCHVCVGTEMPDRKQLVQKAYTASLLIRPLHIHCMKFMV